MTSPVDIIISVWNRPVEIRCCLAGLVANSPEARLIMVDNGSERETERILDEFAEALDDQAMLIATERNVGFTVAINRGLAAASAPVLVIAREGITTVSGWLTPLLELMESRPDVGIATPDIVSPERGRMSKGRETLETDHGSFGVMAVRRNLYDTIGGFDEEMDAGIWSLRDYSRRAERAGFVTCHVPVTGVTVENPIQLGSLIRREERARHDQMLYCDRWGVPGEFCIIMADTEASYAIDTIRNLLLQAARQGNSVSVLAGRRTFREMKTAGFDSLHQSIFLESLPLLFSGRALRRRVDEVTIRYPGIFMVNGSESNLGGGGVTLSGFEQMLKDARDKHYSGRV